MSELKKYELTVECTSFDGSQTFACYADNETQALNLFKAGKCVIIDEQIEVIGLEREPFEIVESENIDSRLSSNIICELNDTIAEQEKVISEFATMLERIINETERSFALEVSVYDDTESLLTKHKQSKGE